MLWWLEVSTGLQSNNIIFNFLLYMCSSFKVVSMGDILLISLILFDVLDVL